MDAHVTHDPAAVLAAAAGHLASRPVEHNLVLGLLTDRAHPPAGRPAEAGRYAWVADGDGVAGVFFQSPTTFHGAITTMPAAVAERLADAALDLAPDLPGVTGEAATAAAFAGRWAERTHRPARPDEGQRLYRLDRLVDPPPVPGRARPAGPDDVDVVTELFDGFRDDVGMHHVPGGTREAAVNQIAGGRLRLWEVGGEVVGVAGASDPVAGIARVRSVYTRPAWRGRGIGAACTAAVTRDLLDAGTTPSLYTQLANPTSNGVYRRLGYRPVAELLHYTFDGAGTA